MISTESKILNALADTEPHARRIGLATDIKNAARGRWGEILASLCPNIPAESLASNRHRPCPLCGGVDRFRKFDNFDETGGVYCNQCHAEKNSDGISTLQWALGIDFKAAVKMLADYLGTNSNGRAKASNGKPKAAKKKTLAENAKKIEAINAASRDAVLRCYCTAKPPVTPDGIKQCGGVPVRWNGFVCARFDAHNPIDSEEPTAIVLCRNDGKPFPLVGKLGERKTHTVGGSVNSWLCSGTVEELQWATTIIDVEGITDWLAVVSAGLPDGWVAVTNTAGAKARDKLPREWARGKRIIIAGDADEPGRDGARRAATAYVKAGAAEVLMGQLPYAIEPDHGRDLRDWLLDGHCIEELPTVAVTAEQAAEWGKANTKKPSYTEREIVVGTDESRVVDEAIEALATRDSVYQRGGCLVEVLRDKAKLLGVCVADTAPRIANIRLPRLQELLSESAEWRQPGGEEAEDKPIHPPLWVTKAVDARGQWPGIRPIVGIIETPTIRPNGTILQSVGYDPQTGFVYQPPCEYPPVPSSPKIDDARRAVASLLEVVGDVPFARPEHRSGWLALVLTLIGRPAFDGCSPLIAIDSNTRGSGKSLCVDVASIIATGRNAPRMAMPRDEDESRKRITSIVLASLRHVLIDNVTRLGGDALDAALTADVWQDRLLGRSEMVTLPLRLTWTCTGNNLQIIGDTIRRVLPVRLETAEEHPEDRANFCHPNLREWVSRERPLLATACVTLLAAYCSAGRPDMGLRPWGSFEGWGDLIRNAIVWAGEPDPAGNRREMLSAADTEGAILRRLLRGWAEVDPSGHGLTVAETLRRLAEFPEQFETLRSALLDMCPPGKAPSPRTIGMKLHHLRGRVVSGCCFDRREVREGMAWRVVAHESAELDGSSGTNPTPRTRAGTHTRTRDTQLAGGSSASSATSAPGLAPCIHDWIDTRTDDGRVKRSCSLCDEFFGYAPNEVRT
jgi:phage/plasmid primase-like uncharacterized protein